MFQYEQALYAQVALLDCLSKQGHFWRYWIFYQEGAPVVAATVCVASQAGAAPAFSAARMEALTGCGSAVSFSGRAA